jgi:hypothetical protein
MVLAKNFHKQKSGKVNNYWRIISPNCRQRRKLYFGSAGTLFEAEGQIKPKSSTKIYVESEGQIIQPPTTIVGQVGSEGNIFFLHILNRHHYQFTERHSRVVRIPASC